MGFGSPARVIVAPFMPGLARKESRGAHARPHDFPNRDDESFMKHSISCWVNGGPELSYKDVRYTKYDPMERKY